MQGSHENKENTDASHVRWRVTTTTGVQFACRVYIIGARIEVRLTTDQDTLVCARAVPSLDAAGEIVRRWLRAVVAGDGINELISDSPVDLVH